MQQSYKAALFAALVFPGSGHLLLKHFPAGILFAGTTLACLVALVARAMEIAQVISERILNGEIALDLQHLSAEISAQSAADGSTVTSVATWLLVFCWIASSVDAFRLGRRLDRASVEKDSGNRRTSAAID
jgi:hypothetical protein